MGFSSSRKSGGFKVGGFGSQGIAAQKLAVESLKNIADVNLSTTSDDSELSSILDILRRGPMPIADVAARLHWTSDRAANALARGGEDGALKFFNDDGTTVVALS